MRSYVDDPTRLMLAWLSTTGSDWLYDCRYDLPDSESDQVKDYFQEAYWSSQQFQKLISEDELLDIDWDVITEFVQSD